MAYSHMVMVILGEDDGRVKGGEWGPASSIYFFSYFRHDYQVLFLLRCHNPCSLLNMDDHKLAPLRQNDLNILIIVKNSVTFFYFDF